MKTSTQDQVTELEPLSALPGVAFPASESRNRDLLKCQEAVVALGRRAIAPPDLKILMQDASTLIAEMLEAEHSAFARLSPDGASLKLQLSLGQPDGGQPSVVLQELPNNEADSLVGYAMETAYPLIVDNLSEETRFRDFLLRKHKVRSAIAVPLACEGNSFGALVACSSRPRHFSTGDTPFAETIAHLVTTTIARTRIEQALARQQSTTTAVLQTLEALVLMLDCEGRIIEINRACEQVTGFSQGETKNRHFWNVFTAPEEISLFRATFQKLRQGTTPIRYESSLLTKHSERHRVAWSCAAITGPGGTIESVVATGIDLTGQRVAEQRAERSEEVSGKTRQVMEESSNAASGRASGESACEASPATNNQIYDSLNRLPGIINRERRSRPRRSYPYSQSIAPIFEGKLPDRNAFTRIECNDIGAGGFSFLSSKPLDSDTLVVALGNPPDLTYLIAQIAHVTRVEQDGKHKYLIGCNYIGRADYQ